MFAVVTAFSAIAFISANLILKHLKIPGNGRPYRVEINRISLEIEESGVENIDLSKCEYVYNIEKSGGDFYHCSSDYLIREIDGELYRFDYNAGNMTDLSPIIIAVNIILAAMTALVTALLFFVRARILRPFERLSSIPYELSKGYLTAPVKENESRFFGKFLWGVDLLRENMEQQKTRELELQKEKKTLLLSLSHDIKTPLSAIKLYAGALSKDLYPDVEKQHETARLISKKADEIEAYISQITTACREDFLNFDVEDGEFYLSELVQSITEYYGEKLALVKQEFVVGDFKDRLLFGDLNRAVEILQNVMENAIKYGDGNRIEIFFPDDEEGVLISIKNGGCSLDISELPHIFESFHRGANAENIRGSGLGLYICRQLIHKMNGEIFAEIHEDLITVTMVFSRA